MDSYTILVAGVGGMGVMRVSQVLATCAHASFPFACRTEARGLSQRGGPALSAVRFGSTALVASLGTEEDLFLSLDALETLRLLPSKRQGAWCLSNTEFLPVTHGSAPDEESKIKERVKTRLSQNDCIGLNLGYLAESVAAPNCQNVVLLGAASRLRPFSPQSLLCETVKQIPGQCRATIERAFNVGWSALRKRI